MIESRAERDPMLHYKVRELAIIGEELKLFCDFFFLSSRLSLAR
jgi:hypothetical protein